jgi:hypothetical protein
MSNAKKPTTFDQGVPKDWDSQQAAPVVSANQTLMMQERIIMALVRKLGMKVTITAEDFQQIAKTDGLEVKDEGGSLTFYYVQRNQNTIYLPLKSDTENDPAESFPQN